jgi:hypothetical protein
MASMREYAVSADDVLRPYGELDVLAYYGLIAQKLETYLHGRELATRIWPPQAKIRSIIIRSPYSHPLFIQQLAHAVTPEMMSARAKFKNLEAAKHALSPDQALVWLYFPSRRMIELYYATNREGEGREINRVVYDIARGKGVSAEDAMDVAALLANAAMEDDMVRGLASGKPFVSWTGNSFQLTLLLKAMQPARFFNDQLIYTGRGNTLTDRLVNRVIKEAKVSVTGGPVRAAGYVVIDPSPTPSGHLCEVPLGSLHMKDAMTLEGVSVPLEPDMLRRGEVDDLQSYTPQRVIDELDQLAKRLP